MLRLHGDAQQMMTKFNPSVQLYAVTHPEYSVTNTSVPSLSVVSSVYGPKVTQAWLEIQLRDLMEFVGVKDKMSPMQIMQTATIILTKYYYLKLSELMVFFMKMKSGEFGEFYGVVDPQKILSVFPQFLWWRGMMIEKVAKEEEARKEKLSMKDAITIEDWELMREAYMMWEGFMLPESWNEHVEIGMNWQK